jgi:3-deoxy-manno-octulosonate cytidylyltransferase (CMP-KDO synthetase)
VRDSRQDVLAVIPARWGAQRFPGKPLALIAGKPLIQWVWEATRAAKRVSRVVVATDSERIAAAVRGFGGEVAMTSPHCPSGTDRVARVARTSRAGLVINVQGDEPLLSPRLIDQVVEALQQDRLAVMATAARRAKDDREWRDPNAVKVVMDSLGYALYFSRSPIPCEAGGRTPSRTPHWIHIGLYGFRRPFLFRFASLPPTLLERTERLEQLRALEQGCPMKVVLAATPSCAVDRPEDVRRVEQILAKSHARE